MLPLISSTRDSTLSNPAHDTKQTRDLLQNKLVHDPEVSVKPFIFSRSFGDNPNPECDADEGYECTA